MAASLAGSRPGCRPAAWSGLEPGHRAAPTPRAELSRTRLAISSGTPSAAEGCASGAVSGPEFPPATGFGCWPGREPEDLARMRCELAPGNPEPPWPAPARAEPGRAELDSSRSNPPRPGIGRNAASPSVGKSSAWRIDLALKRIGIYLEVRAGRIECAFPDELEGLAASIGCKAPLVLLYPTGCPAGAACASPLWGA